MMKRMLPALLALVLVCAPGMGGQAAEGAAEGVPEWVAAGLDTDAWLASFAAYMDVYADPVALEETAADAHTAPVNLRVARALAAPEEALTLLFCSRDRYTGVSRIHLTLWPRAETDAEIDAAVDNFLSTIACAVLASAPDLDAAGIVKILSDLRAAFADGTVYDGHVIHAYDRVAVRLEVVDEAAMAVSALIGPLPEDWRATKPEGAYAIGVGRWMADYQAAVAKAGLAPLSLYLQNASTGAEEDAGDLCFRMLSSPREEITLDAWGDVRRGFESATFWFDINAPRVDAYTLTAFAEHIACAVVATAPQRDGVSHDRAMREVVEATLTFAGSDAEMRLADIAGVTIVFFMGTGSTDGVLCVDVYVNTDPLTKMISIVEPEGRPLVPWRVAFEAQARAAGLRLQLDKGAYRYGEDLWSVLTYSLTGNAALSLELIGFTQEEVAYGYITLDYGGLDEAASAQEPDAFITLAACMLTVRNADAWPDSEAARAYLLEKWAPLLAGETGVIVETDADGTVFRLTRDQENDQLHMLMDF